MLIKRPANVGELASEYVQFPRLGIGGMHQTKTYDIEKNSSPHLARLARNEANNNRYVPKNCKVTVEEEEGRDPSRTVVWVRPEILHFARKGERIVIIENGYKSSELLNGTTRLVPTHQQGRS